MTLPLPRQAPSNVRNAVLSDIKRRKDLYQERDEVAHQLRRMRLMRHQVYVPKPYAQRIGGKKAVRLPIMMRLLQTAVAAVAKRFPIVHNEPLKASDQRAAEEASRADSLLLQSVEYQLHRPYLYTLYFALFGDGMSGTKTGLGPWGGYPIPPSGEVFSPEECEAYNQLCEEYLEHNPLPFVSRIFDGLTFYPPINEYGEGACVESGWRSTYDVLKSLDQLPQKAPTDTIPGSRPVFSQEMPPGWGPSVLVDEIWTDSECAVVVNGNVLIYENPLGEVPYEWGYADPTGVEDPSNIGMSIAYPLYYLTPAIDSLANIMLSWANFASPTPYTEQMPGPGVRPTQETRIDMYEPGKMMHLATGRKMGVLSPPPVGDNLIQALNFLVESADRGGLPALVSGAGVGTRLPALTFSAAIEAATDRLHPARQSAEKIIAGTLMKWHRVIGRYDVPIKVNGWEYSEVGERKEKGWAVIQPSEARKGRRVEVSLAVDSTQDTISKGTHAQFMVNAKLWDVEQAMRFSGVENPQQMKDRIDADDIHRAAIPVLTQAILMADPQMGPMIQMEMESQAQAQGGEAPKTGRNRKGVPSGRGGGKRGGPTHKPRGNRGGQ